MHRTVARPVAMLASAVSVLVLLLSGCTAEPEGPDPTPSVAEESPAGEEDAGGDGGTTASPSAEPSAEAEEGTDEPGTPSAGGSPGTDSPGQGSGTGWSPPDDSEAEGPTAAPELPEVEGRAGDTIELPSGVVVSLTGIATTTLEAETPGEYSGTAIVVTVEVANDSSDAQDVGSAVVSLSAEDGEIGVPTGAAPYSPLAGQVAAGGTVQGTYVFMLDPASGRNVTVRVNHSAGEPVAVFTGQAR